MTDMQILERVSEIVADTVGVHKLALEPSMTAADVDGWDSLAHVQIIVALETTFGVRFRIGEMTSIANVGELVRRIASRSVSSR